MLREYITQSCSKKVVPYDTSVLTYIQNIVNFSFVFFQTNTFIRIVNLKLRINETKYQLF